MRPSTTIRFLTILSVLACVTRAGAVGTKTFTAGNFALSVDGGEASFVASVEGGNAVGQVTATPGAVPNKRLTGQLLFEPMKVRFTPGSAPALETWLAEGLLPGMRRASGELKLLDTAGKPVSRRTYQDAGIQVLSIPVLDAGSTEPLSFTATLLPTRTTYVADPGGAGGKIGTKAAKAVLASSFRLSIDGLDATGVAKVEGFTVTQTLSGGGVPQAVQVSNFAVAIVASKSGGWFDWFDAMTAPGAVSDDEERSGQLEILSANGQNVVATVELHGLGIVSIGAERADGWVTKKGASNASGRVKAELYCERVAYRPAS